MEGNAGSGDTGGGGAKRGYGRSAHTCSQQVGSGDVGGSTRSGDMKGKLEPWMWKEAAQAGLPEEKPAIGKNCPLTVLSLTSFLPDLFPP